MEGFGEAIRKFGQLADALDGTSLQQVTTRVAVAAKKDALEALGRDLPKHKFTNWRPTLSAGFDVQSPSTALVKPRPSGPWSVLEQGRSRGRKFSKKRGRVVGWGPTQGHGTWTKAGAVIVAETPKRVHDEVTRVLERLFL